MSSMLHSQCSHASWLTLQLIPCGPLQMSEALFRGPRVVLESFDEVLESFDDATDNGAEELDFTFSQDHKIIKEVVCLWCGLQQGNHDSRLHMKAASS